MGDDARHATASVHYEGQMRLAATVYVADISEDNIEAIMKHYTQVYPPRNRPDLLMEIAGSHWKPNDSNATLPRSERLIQMPTCDRFSDADVWVDPSV